MKISPQPMSKKTFLELLEAVHCAFAHRWFNDKIIREKEPEIFAGAQSFSAALHTFINSKNIDWDTENEIFSVDDDTEITPKMIDKDVFQDQLTAIVFSFYSQATALNFNFDSLFQYLDKVLGDERCFLSFLRAINVVEWKDKKEEKL